MRIGLAYLLQETNTFSPLLSRLEDFGVTTGAEAAERWRGTRTEIGAFLDVLQPTPHEAVPLFAGWGMTEGPIERAEFEKMLALVRAEVLRAGKLDALLIALHGAMAAEGTGDCEGTILSAIRSLVGDIPIVLTLDLHANLTPRMVSEVNALVGYHTYPHIDMYETGVKAAELLLRLLRGEIHPVMAMRKLPLIVPAENMMTTGGPFAQVFAAGNAAGGGLLSYSVFGVQPWLDVAGIGCATLVVADGDEAAAEACAARMANLFWELREQFEVELMSPRAAVEEALATVGQPVVLAEPSDSPTAGSPGDSADMLAAFREYAPEAPSALWV
ncbi:MAG: M81 family metallopeptidase, partial [Acidobacteria bacterium]|nr:M81 family metallopeptidase [Acidobacteriota bacterium]